MKKPFTMKEASKRIALRLQQEGRAKFSEIEKIIVDEFSQLPESPERMATRVIQRLTDKRKGAIRIEKCGQYKFGKTFRGIYRITAAGKAWLLEPEKPEKEKKPSDKGENLGYARIVFFSPLVAKKSVIDLESGEKFASVTQAAKAFGMSKQALSCALNGSTQYRMPKGVRLAYA